MQVTLALGVLPRLLQREPVAKLPKGRQRLLLVCAYHESESCEGSARVGLLRLLAGKHGILSSRKINLFRLIGQGGSPAKMDKSQDFVPMQ